MLFEGQSIYVQSIEDGIYDVVFDRKGDAVNKLDQVTLAELREAVAAVCNVDNIRGVIFSSAKDCFIVGADITEFMGFFSADDEELIAGLTDIHTLLNQIEDMSCPTVTAINGLCLGGGFELALSTDYRVMSDQAKVGLPEVKLGIYPGWGGTVRLPRLIGVDNANEWICGGAEKRPDAALIDGGVDAVVAVDQVKAAALDLLKGCISGKFDYQARRDEKKSPIKLNQVEQMMAFESAKGVIGGKAGPHYPAPMAALKTIQKGANLPRDKALAVEAKGFIKVAKTDVCAALVGLFLKDQYVKKVSKDFETQAEPVNKSAVLGAGIMGGGVAYQSASKGTPILMKDINEGALQLGLDEATKLLNKRVSRGRMDSMKMASVLNSITPTLNYGDFSTVDIVVEAVVENPKVKKAVLAEVEGHLPEGAVLTSNTSTISITELATALKNPENFCGMHFFNPVHLMPLVEVIRGEKTSEQAVARTVAYAKAMGKTPIVVNDCPGFLVNRILFPYFGGFSALLADGADFQKVDKVMERFGWPMGPAYLLDVVGIDTAHHADAVMSVGFPDRMQHEGENSIDRMYKLERFGQKNSKGFYRYELDRKGKPKKLVDEDVPQLLQGIAEKSVDFSDEEIIERMMIPLCIETVRCLEDGIVASPAEADMGLIYGIGFPPFRGGAFHYMDQIGLDNFCEMAKKYEALGPLYQPTEKMKQMAAAGDKYFPQAKG
ncbi:MULTISPECIES: fatty acid oxidation complex subunit alpha FadB [unclassified Neptuniibacter]|uniref:fatty acid oxidation complex subunit alpha FadB n=1 Tax=unclassified Neptuniibacter TaxID=2630693 RepID=UPI000C53AC37|nr:MULTISPECIES: fatty acid oxidation complex subunit alpha FadB [unclassified Neptuniibacter]MAY42242.1 fatty acid oxidation complex subunit alpha FadB [Oceanospirillaceae bacterium]|tara:strand:- start:12483 stop:14642 length:2160 start_codon:yes stop_codon:yes gene_type:complete